MRCVIFVKVASKMWFCDSSYTSQH